MSQPKYQFVPYLTEHGKAVVNDEIRHALPGGPPRKELGELLSRIQWNRQLPNDTEHLGDGLWEARLSYQGNEYRLYYGHAKTGLVLVMVKFARKGGQGAQQRAIKIARKRLADWKRRDV